MKTIRIQNIGWAVALTMLLSIPGISRADNISDSNSSALAISSGGAGGHGGAGGAGGTGIGIGGAGGVGGTGTGIGGAALSQSQGGSINGGLSPAAGVNFQYSPSSYSNYEAQKRTIFSPNGFQTGVLSPNIFGPLDQGANASGMLFNFFALNVCHQANVVQDIDALAPFPLIHGNNTTIAFQPLSGYAMKQPGTRSHLPRMTDVMFDVNFDDESSYACLGVALIQADEESDMIYVNEASMFHDMEVFMKSNSFQGYSYLVALTAETTVANQRRLESEGFGATLAPSISGMLGSVLSGNMASVTMAQGESNPQTRKGMTFLILGKSNPWESWKTGGRMIASPKAWFAKRNEAIAVELEKNKANNNHTTPEKSVGAGVVK